MIITPAQAYLSAGDDPFNPSPDAIALLQRVQEYNWPIFEFTEATKGRPLATLVYHLFRRADLFSAFEIPMDLFRNCVTAIENGYRKDLSFHNSVHASDVLHCTNYFIFQSEAVSSAAGDSDMLALYIAAMIHDFDHPGVNNNFLINSYDPKAILYNDRSVLENHHLASAFEVMNRPENNFLRNLKKDTWKEVREFVIDMVLATDLSQHFQLMSSFKTKVGMTSALPNPTDSTHPSSSSTFNPHEIRNDRLLLWKIIIKCADVSNPTKTWTLYGHWCRLIFEEFLSQGDRERRLGLDISPYMDRMSINFPSCQNGFMEFVVMPLFEAYDKWAPVPGLLAELKRNKDNW
ncbi:hypothetical protein BC832DRAFT_530676 [Gaertneriomyces semiglobifer]|nr:hypothetical protein BC832DRAFT_530676 [Gaertneriomyces semiglobifer]